MNIPQSFKNAQIATFQDKTIQHYTLPTTIDSEGHVIAGTPVLVGPHTVNVQTISDKLVAEAWGLTVQRDIRISSSGVLSIARGDLVKWNSIFYKVVGDESRDAYVALFCQRYEG